MRIYIVRHGETRANLEGRFQGWSDDPLNRKGRMLARETGRALQGICFEGCFSSPLLRARETADILLRESGNRQAWVREDERLKEINMGQWERKRFRPEKREVDEEQSRLFFTDPFALPSCPGGESARQVCERTQAFLRELTEAEQGQNYLITTHGFALRAMLNFLYDNPADFWHGHVPYNCALNIIETENGNCRLVQEDLILYQTDQCVDRYAEY